MAKRCDPFEGTLHSATQPVSALVESLRRASRNPGGTGRDAFPASEFAGLDDSKAGAVLPCLVYLATPNARKPYRGFANTSDPAQPGPAYQAFVTLIGAGDTRVPLLFAKDSASPAVPLFLRAVESGDVGLVLAWMAVAHQKGRLAELLGGGNLFPGTNENALHVAARSANQFMVFAMLNFLKDKGDILWPLMKAEDSSRLIPVERASVRLNGTADPNNPNDTIASRVSILDVFLSFLGEPSRSADAATVFAGPPRRAAVFRDIAGQQAAINAAGVRRRRARPTPPGGFDEEPVTAENLAALYRRAAGPGALGPFIPTTVPVFIPAPLDAIHSDFAAAVERSVVDATVAVDAPRLIAQIREADTKAVVPDALAAFGTVPAETDAKATVDAKAAVDGWMAANRVDLLIDALVIVSGSMAPAQTVEGLTAMTNPLLLAQVERLGACVPTAVPVPPAPDPAADRELRDACVRLRGRVRTLAIARGNLTRLAAVKSVADAEALCARHASRDGMRARMQVAKDTLTKAFQMAEALPTPISAANMTQLRTVQLASAEAWRAFDSMKKILDALSATPAPVVARATLLVTAATDLQATIQTLLAVMNLPGVTNAVLAPAVAAATGEITVILARPTLAISPDPVPPGSIPGP